MSTSSWASASSASSIAALMLKLALQPPIFTRVDEMDPAAFAPLPRLDLDCFDVEIPQEPAFPAFT